MDPPVQIGQYVLGKNLGIGAFGKVSLRRGSPPSTATAEPMVSRIVAVVVNAVMRRIPSMCSFIIRH